MDIKHQTLQPGSALPRDTHERGEKVKQAFSWACAGKSTAASRHFKQYACSGGDEAEKTEVRQMPWLAGLVGTAAGCVCKPPVGCRLCWLND
eukprot:1155704-Pelagomonas_calceolata.AAC.2